jgi:hypothetical protein
MLDRTQFVEGEVAQMAMVALVEGQSHTPAWAGSWRWP